MRYLMIIAVVLLAFLPARAAQPTMPEGYVWFDTEKHCDRSTLKCVISLDLLHQISQANQFMDVTLRKAATVLEAQTAEIGRLREENEKLRALKGCGKVEIIPDGTRKRS